MAITIFETTSHCIWTIEWSLGRQALQPMTVTPSRQLAAAVTRNDHALNYAEPFG